jgi:hypothetical protein
MSYKIIWFNNKANGWYELKSFDTEKQAQNFINEYPRFGSQVGRAIREGNWQIVK